jgi:ectoine hydroxylase-related dioxygenase (phytanoyl-CoA dioxygenase family)
LKSLPRFHKVEPIRNYMQRYEAGRYGDHDVPKPSKVFNMFADEDGIRNAREIPLNQGDVVIWSNNLPHCGGTNTLDRWRLQTFIRFLAMDGPTYPRSREKQNKVIMYRDSVFKSARS